jgi:hypothetical protein
VTPLPEPHLRAVAAPGAVALSGDGLALAYAALERVRSEHRLDRLIVVVDDARLGRQLLVVPRGQLASAEVDEELGWRADPALAESPTDLDLAVALCRLAVRAASDDDRSAGPLDELELALRRLDGVEAVTMDDGGELLLVQTGPTAPPGLNRAVLETVKTRLDRTVVVQLVGPGGPAGRDGRTPEAISWAPDAPLEVVAVRTEPETGELEVHLRGGDVRTLGRTASRGLVGAATATLEAWHARPDAPQRAIGWARTVETSADGRFVVAVALEDSRRVTVAHGIGSGPNPLEAAVAATVDALIR